MALTSSLTGGGTPGISVQDFSTWTVPLELPAKLSTSHLSALQKLVCDSLVDLQVLTGPAGWGSLLLLRGEGPMGCSPF